MKLSARNQLKGKIIDVMKGATTSHVFCPDCSQKMRIIMAIPTHDGRERRTYECAYGHRKSIEVSLTSSPIISRAQRLSIHEVRHRERKSRR
jgi:hypothetical protein